jgi:hypothetical protein
MNSRKRHHSQKACHYQQGKELLLLSNAKMSSISGRAVKAFCAAKNCNILYATPAPAIMQILKRTLPVTTLGNWGQIQCLYTV